MKISPLVVALKENYRNRARKYPSNERGEIENVIIRIEVV